MAGPEGTAEAWREESPRLILAQLFWIDQRDCAVILGFNILGVRGAKAACSPVPAARCRQFLEALRADG
jgi:hypothetical protein